MVSGTATPLNRTLRTADIDTEKLEELMEAVTVLANQYEAVVSVGNTEADASELRWRCESEFWSRWCLQCSLVLTRTGAKDIDEDNLNEDEDQRTATRHCGA